MKNLAKTAAISLFAMATLSATSAFAVDEHYLNGDAVVGGYDVVAYHTEGAPMQGFGMNC